MKKICPICKGLVYPYLGFKTGMIYQCNKCGYRGPLAITVKAKSKKKR